MLHRVPRVRRPFIAVGSALTMLLTLAGSTAAHHAEVTASMNCSSVVSFTAYAWNGSTSASRTNPDIGVWYSREGGPFIELTSPRYRFGRDNNYQFSDT